MFFLRQRSPAIGRWVLLVAVMLAVIGAKLRLIDRYGSDLPYWDQWDGEGDRMLRPYMEGKLTAADLFAPHNEHRPVLTRLWALALFEAGDRQWDDRVQMAANTVLHVAVALLLVALAWRALSPPAAVAFGALTAVLFSSAVSWENTLAGFQSQFYFLLLFSALHIGATWLARPRSLLWWLAPVAGIGGLLSMAAGPLSALANLAGWALRAARDRRIGRDDLWVVATNVALVIAGFWLKAKVPEHEALKTATATAWLSSFLHQLSWPLRFSGVGVVALTPGIALAVSFYRRRIDGAIATTLIAAVTWWILQAAAIAYARGAGNYGYSSRYFDTLSIGILANVLSLAYLIRSACPPRLRTSAIATLAIALAGVAWGLARERVDAEQHILGSLDRVQQSRIVAVRDYLATHDDAFFAKKGWDQLPYPDARRLAQLLDTPSLRKILPASVRLPPAIEPDGAATNAFAPDPPPGAPATPDQRKAWYSAPGKDAHFTSAPVKLDHGRVTLFVIGESLGRARLWLTDAQGREVRIALPPAAPQWRNVTFIVRRGWYRLHVARDGAGWIGFTQPTTNATLAVFAQTLAAAGRWIFVVGVAAFAIAAIAIMRPNTVEPVKRGRHLAAAFAAGCLALPLLVAILERNRATSIASADDSEPAMRDFALTDASGAADAKYRGAAFVMAGDPSRWWGTYVDGDGFTGTITSTPFTLSEPLVHVPITGYPNFGRNSLALEIFGANGKVRSSIAYTGSNPGEHPGRWDISTAEWVGAQARLVLTDRETAPRGWLAVGAPVIRARPGVRWLEGVPRNYGRFAIASLTLAVLLFLPGLALRTWRRQPASFASSDRPTPPTPMGAAALGLPGFALLVLGGVAIWIGGSAAFELLAPLWLALHVALAGWLCCRWWHDGIPCDGDELRSLAVYGCAVVAALALGVLPLEIAQEFDPHSTAQARMIASPPDHAIPYRTAVYFWFGKSGREDRAAYFGEDWSVASRGPLLPLATTAAFAVFNAHPTDPPADAISPWPASNDGFYVARILAILVNAWVILGGAALARRLAPESACLALVWLAVSPVVAINTDFIWPKLLATFFILLAIEAVLARRRLGYAGLYTALAYLSHPLGGLFAIPLATWLAHRTWSELPGATAQIPGGSNHAARMRATFRQVLTFAAIVAACLLPWLAYKLWLGYPDKFARYPLGDSRGFETAATIASWLRCRWSNLWLSLVPGAFYFSPYMHQWLAGALSEPLRWAIGYAKTMPGELGIAAYCVGCYAVIARPPNRTFAQLRIHFLGGALALLLVFWGFSDDGLGRNCLEPLAVLVAVYAVAARPNARWWSWVVLVAAIESLLVRIIGVTCAPGFSGNAGNGEVLALGTIVIAASLAPAAWLLSRRWRTHDLR